MNIKDIIRVLSPIEVIGDIETDINNFLIDSRKAASGDAFVGIVGENGDGNDYYMDAFSKGADLCILSKKLDFDLEYIKNNNKMIIIVSDTVIALKRLAMEVRNNFGGKVIAITGSVGKTSTKELVSSVLSKDYKVLKTEGNYNNHLGLPLTILSYKDEDVMVLEMGMNHPNEITYLAEIARPDIAIITNVGTAHIGNLGSRENILKAKLEITDYFTRNSILIFNNDCDILHDYVSNNKLPYKVIKYGINNDTDIKLDIISLDNDKTIIKYKDKEITIPVAGEHYLLNAMSALAVSEVFDIDIDNVKYGIEHFALIGSRMNILKVKDYTIIDDAYNANYDSIKYVLKYIGRLSGRRIAVLGTMRELGEYSLKLHSDLGIDVVENNIDVLITVGDYTDEINKKALELGFNMDNQYHFDNNKETIEFLKSFIKKDDIVVLKASHSCNFSEIIDAIK